MGTAAFRSHPPSSICFLTWRAIALDVVTSLADSPKTGAEKRAAAVDAIKAQAIQTGIAATTSAVNLAVELAVQKLNPPTK